MAYIDLPADDDATGALARSFQAARQRAGRVYEIVRTMSPNPAVLDASMGLYIASVHGDSPLSRSQREMLATVVSNSNHCHY